MNAAAMVRVGYGLISVVVLVFDQLTKLWITSRMTIYSSVTVIPGFVHLTLVTNKGALFGLLRNLGDPLRIILFTAVPLIAIALILFFQFRSTLTDTLAQFGLALILGGAIGNLVDRVRLGHVIDFLDVFVGDHHWPAFNVADSAICIGVSLLFIDLLRHGRGRRRAESPRGA